VLQVYYIFRRAVLAVLAIAFSAVFGQWCINVAEQHHFYENPLAVLKPLTEGIVYFQNLPGFWIAIASLSGLAVGMYLDAFMRRWAATHPDKKWLSSLKIFDLADPKLMNDAIKVEADNQEIMESIRRYQAERESLIPLTKPPFGSSPITAESEASEAIRILQASVREASLRSSALLETRERARMRALEDIYEKLQNGELIAKGLLEPVGANPKEINIPAEYWRFLKFKSDYKEAEGKGIKFTAIVVAR
jgi:hypothetical protein